MKQGYLIIDSSSETLRTYVITIDGNIVAQKSAPIINFPDGRYKDALEFDVKKYKRDLITLCKNVVASARGIQIIAASSTSQREGVVILDKNGKALGGYPNVDNRGMDWENTIEDKSWVYSIGGRWVSTLFSALKLVGIRAIYPNIWENANKIMSISDWIGFIFTNEMGYEPSQAGETLLFDIEKNNWSRELCDTFGISMNMLPQIVYCGDILGSVKDDIVKEIGLKDNIPFVVGGADTQLAVKSSMPAKGDITIVAGTTSPIISIVDKYFVDKEERCWVNRYVEKGLYAVETNVGVSGANYDRALKIFYPGVVYEEVEKEMRKCSGDNCLATVGSMIFHKGRVTPRGGFIINTPLRNELSRADMMFAVLMDYAFSFKTNFAELLDITGNIPSAVYGCGGGFNGTILPQMMADLIGQEIHVREGYGNASCYGLVRILNEKFKNFVMEPTTISVIKPNCGSNIGEYYEEWADLREILNG